MLAARDVSVSPPGSGGRAVVSGVSLEVRDGEWVAVTGPNGSGKTSLALALAGLWPVQRGRVELNGRPIGPGERPHTRAAIAMVLQEPSLQLLQSTVIDELAFTARNLGQPEAEVAARVAAWSGRLGLDEVLGLDPRSLSAGLQQLTLLASALVGGPRVLVVDEGGAHWDHPTRLRALAAVREEVARGLSVVWVTQEPSEIHAADRSISLADAPADGPSRPTEDQSCERAAGRAEPAPRPEPLLRIEIGPCLATEGPRVRTSRPLRFDLAPGSLTVLEGPNGSGKSVILESVVGLVSTGQVQVEWLGPRGPGPIFAAQSPDLQIFADTVAEEVLFAATRRGRARREALEAAGAALRRLELPAGLLERRPWELSAGERRMAQVVAAIVAPASLVALDEPTCGLDAIRRPRLVEIVRECATESALLVATQDPTWRQGRNAVRIDLGQTRQ